MTARAIALLNHDEATPFGRWTLAAAIVFAGHLGVVASYMLLRSPEPAGAPAAPAVIIDLAPLPVAPDSQNDAAPGPEMLEAQPPPEPVIETPPPEPLVMDLPPPPPMIEPPVVAAPTPPPPDVKAEPKPKEPPPPEAKRIDRKKPAPRTTAAPRSQYRAASAPAAPTPGSADTRAAIASWRSLVVSRLLAARRSGDRRNEGTVMVSFTVSRSGGVLGRSVIRSSGASELDQEALAMIQRAAPYPAFPPSMTQASQHLTVPIHFRAR